MRVTPASAPLVQTSEHQRFTEFCDDCKRYRYIGLCYGLAGVGKTLSARHYAEWDTVESFWRELAVESRLLKKVSAGSTVFCTARVFSTPSQIQKDIDKTRSLRREAAVMRARRFEGLRVERLSKRLEGLRDPWRNPGGFRNETMDAIEENLIEARTRAVHAPRTVPDPTALVVIDEADRLREAALEQVRDIFDRAAIGLILIGMRDFEKRLARYPQLYSRVGFVHHFKPMSEAAVAELLERGWTPPGVRLPPICDKEAVGAVIRFSRGNFRHLTRLLAQTERVLEANQMVAVTTRVVEAARESLVLGEV